MTEYLFQNYARKPFEIVSGKDRYVTDNLGRTFLDFTSGIGVMNLGYHLEELNHVLLDQANAIWHVPNLYESHLQQNVAQILANQKEYHTFFCNSGTEANEAAIKLARKATNRSQIITFTNSFHGRTYGGMSATGQDAIKEGFYPLVPDFIHLPFNDIDALESAISDQTAAVMFELIQGEGGVSVADQEWVKAIVLLCQSNGALTIVDEVQTGIGRTGRLFCYEHYEFEPDIVTLAKGLGNGFPVGAMLGKVAISPAFSPGTHGSTFGGNKLAMAVAEAVLTILTSEILPTLEGKSTEFFSLLLTLEKDKIKEIRGKGLMFGIELNEGYAVSEWMNQLEEKGVLALRAGHNTLRLLPPLTMNLDEFTLGVSKLKETLATLTDVTSKQ